MIRAEAVSETALGVQLCLHFLQSTCDERDRLELEWPIGVS